VNRNTVAVIPDGFDFCNFKAARLKKRSFQDSTLSNTYTSSTKLKKGIGKLKTLDMVGLVAGW